MRAAETTSQLAGFADRGAGTDAERRAARWLAGELAQTRREVHTETFWCRPNWALAHAWHAALALVGSLVSVGTPRVGIVLLVVALLSLIADAVAGVSPGRRLTPERASQNVVAVHPAPDPPDRTRLIITANYDAGRTGLVYRDAARRAAAVLRRAAGPVAFGWLGSVSVAIAWLLAVAFVRAEGSHGTAISVIQLPPSVGLVLAVALLIEQGTARYSPAAGDNASGTAVAIALVRALDAAPPRHLAIELVLQGAGDGGGIGLHRYLRRRRRELGPANGVVLGISPCGAGALHYWLSDGPLVPLRFSRQLTELCAAVSQDTSGRAHHGRGATPALAGRRSRLAATAIGRLDVRGVAPRSHQGGDVAAGVDPAALDDTTQFGLLLVDALDAYLAVRAEAQIATPA